MTFPHRWLGHNIFLYPTQEDLFPRSNSHSACLSTANYIIGLILLLSRVVSRRGRSNLWVLRPPRKHQINERTNMNNHKMSVAFIQISARDCSLSVLVSRWWWFRILKQNKNQFGGNVIKINVTLYSELCLLRASLRYCRCCCWSHSFIPGSPPPPPPHTFVTLWVYLIRSGCATSCWPNKYTPYRTQLRTKVHIVWSTALATPSLAHGQVVSHSRYQALLVFNRQ